MLPVQSFIKIIAYNRIEIANEKSEMKSHNTAGIGWQLLE